MGRNPVIDDTAFSRSGTTDAEGKLAEKLQIPVTSEFLERITGLAFISGKPRAEVARILLIKAVEGELAYLRSVGLLPGYGEDRKGV